MTKEIPELTPTQWEFLAVFEALDTPTAVEMVGELVPLLPGPFLDLLRRAKTHGWLKQTDPDTYCLAPDMPPQIERRLKAINDPTHISALLARIEQMGLRDRLSPDCLTKILARTGKKYEAAVLENERAQQALEKGDLVSAVSCLDKIISLLDGVEGMSESDVLFVKTALTISNLRLRLGDRLGEVPELLQRARSVANGLGDRRSRAIIDLHLGRFAYVGNNLSGAISSLVSGLDEVEELGDEDILSQSAEFVGLYYFFQGMYKDAAKHFERAMLITESQSDNLVNFFVSYAFGYCTAYLGQFHRAVGVLDYNWRRYKQKSEFGLASLFRSALGIVLLMMGKKEVALSHLQGAQEDSRQHHKLQPLLMSQVGLSYYHFLEGRIEESAQVMPQSLIKAAKTHFAARRYTLPFILEQLFEFEQLGNNPQPFYLNFEEEMEKVINGPNIHLRGVACRIRAQEALNKGDEISSIRSKLEASERYFKRSGDPVELAKTRAQMARVELQAEDPEKATRLAQSAYNTLSLYAGAFFPEELRPLLKDTSGQTGQRDSQAQILERFLDMMEELVPSANLEELLGRVVATSARFYGAERGGLFWFEDEERGQNPVLRAGYNLSDREVQAESFHSNLAMVFKAFHNNQPLLVRAGQGVIETGQPLTILCLPFEVRGRVRGVLYHDNSYIDERFDFPDRTMIQRVVRQMSTYIERIWDYTRLVERKNVLAVGQSALTDGTKRQEIVAQSLGMLQLLASIDKVADSKASVLVLGETGAGKELLARRLHQKSSRSTGPFVAVDLSAMPEGLVESELFGHEKGAFTGADRQKPGRLELANKGTLFIDEVGEIPLAFQTKLLRAFQEKSFVRIGGTRTLSSDFRLVAATNRNLQVEVAEGRFREDLYYRLNVVPLKVPPLRERGQDIVFLARHFLRRYTRKHNRPDIGLSPQQETEVMAYHWPGNVRELQNVIERAVLLGEDGSMDLNLPKKSESASSHPFADTPTMEELQRRYISFALEKTSGRIAGPKGAAELLGMKRTTLYTRMKKLGISLSNP